MEKNPILLSENIYYTVHEALFLFSGKKELKKPVPKTKYQEYIFFHDCKTIKSIGIKTVISKIRVVV